MNDTELDELLNTWKTPAPSPAIREWVRVGIETARQKPIRNPFGGWRLAFASAALVAIVFVLANTTAISHQLNPPPYTVESEIIVHPTNAVGCIGLGDIGLDSARCWRYSRPKHTLMTSYNADGSEVLLSWSDPGELLESIFWTVDLAMLSAIERIHRVLSPDLGPNEHAGFYSSADQKAALGERADLLNSGCRPGTRYGEVIGQEVLLGYPTVVSTFDNRQGSRHTRMTLSMAPQLSCFALRGTIEQQEPDGTWTVLSEKKALRVTLSDAKTPEQ